jgi:2-polyprenyl-3-methyl-5-hydroxy-6-metoxy-1,4-benzoquinol methylase
MTLYFHGNASLKFNQQYLVTRDYIIPFISKIKEINEHTKVLEIGCGEGGVLKAFAEKGCECTGMDLSESKIESGKEIFNSTPLKGSVELFTANIYDETVIHSFKNKFNLIVLKDTIEHIPNQERVIAHLKNYLKEDGMIFFAFPPWSMPFGGHQQTCKTKLGQIPYMHLLPKKTYLSFLKKAGESEATIKSLEEIHETGISINRFEQILKREHYKVIRHRKYLVNPIYRYKFKWTPREQSHFVGAIPWFRDFVTTAVYYLVQPKP